MKILVAILCGLLGAAVGRSAEAEATWIYDRLDRSPKFIAAKAACDKGHVPLMCMIEYQTAESADVYIGEDMGDHANRIATARVFRNGTLKYLAYDAAGEEQWIIEEAKK